MRHPDRTAAFDERMWHWFATHKRTLPWRDLKINDVTQRAYMILVSEVMLQQTQVSRVEVIFKRFLREFPAIQDLAKASNKAVIIAWRGMGYNSRALRLRDAAREIVRRQKSEEGQERQEGKNTFPHEYDDLLSIKGIGPYTAAAIRNFAFHLPTPCIDTNIRRILHRVFIGPDNADGTFRVGDKKLLPLAETTLRLVLNIEPKTKNLSGSLKASPRSSSADWHAALMDFGSAICIKKNPRCDMCPMSKGICTSAFRVPAKGRDGKSSVSRKSIKQEPGRKVGSKFIPNRIFRGRIIEALRDEPRGLTLQQIGSQIALDWSEAEHTDWLTSILLKLQKDQMIVKTRGERYKLVE